MVAWWTFNSSKIFCRLNYISAVCIETTDNCDAMQLYQKNNQNSVKLGHWEVWSRLQCRIHYIKVLKNFNPSTWISTNRKSECQNKMAWWSNLDIRCDRFYKKHKHFRRILETYIEEQAPTVKNQWLKKKMLLLSDLLLIKVSLIKDNCCPR